jgi:hypothetical protein
MHNPNDTATLTRSRQSALIEINIHWLHQALTLLTKLDDAAYSTPPAGLAQHRVGAHMRHILSASPPFEFSLDLYRICLASRQLFRL